MGGTGPAELALVTYLHKITFRSGKAFVLKQESSREAFYCEAFLKHVAGTFV